MVSEEFKPVQEACRNILTENRKENYALIARCRPQDPRARGVIEQQRNKIFAMQIQFYENLLKFVVWFITSPTKEASAVAEKLDDCLFPEQRLVTAFKNTYIREAGGDPSRISQVLLDLMAKNSLLAWNILKAIGDEDIENLPTTLNE